MSPLTRFVATLILFAPLALPQALPPAAAPGALNPQVTQANIDHTICSAGWTSMVRPPSSFTNRLKSSQMSQLRIRKSPRDYEEDHRVPLELGGAPRDPANLWPEPWARPYGAHEKDRLENAVHRDVCDRKLSLAAARAIFLGDFWQEYKRRFE